MIDSSCFWWLALPLLVLGRIEGVLNKIPGALPSRMSVVNIAKPFGLLKVRY